MTVALVLGGADCVRRDIDEATCVCRGIDGVVACNDMAAFWDGPIDAAASYHPELLPLWLRKRALAGFEPPARVFAHIEARGQWRNVSGRSDITYIDPRFPGQRDCGSSGLFALKVALIDLGFDKAVICGVPMINGPHFTGDEDWVAQSEHRPAWLEALPEIRDRARSMSGWTRQLLGSPDQAWLKG